jgi:hypothetical protein
VTQIGGVGFLENNCLYDICKYLDYSEYHGYCDKYEKELKYDGELFLRCHECVNKFKEATK